MAQRTTGRSAAAAGDRVGADVHEAGAEVPLNLLPLLMPYKKRGRLSLRVEGLPHRARLSKGRNNGDRSWSLMSDELDGLCYLPPKGMNSPHSLAIRIFGIDEADGATLAVIEYPVFAGNGSAARVPERSASSLKVANSDEGGELRRLNAEIATLKTALGAREDALADLRKSNDEQASRITEQLKAELSAARLAWESELRDRLDAAASDAAAVLEKSRKAWRAEHEQELAKTEKQVQERIVAAREQWRAEAEQALAKAKKAWSEEQAARSASGEAELQRLQDATARCESAEASAAEAHMKVRQLETALTEARGRAERAEAQGAHALSESGERRRLQEELTAAQSQLAAQHTDLAQLRAEMKLERERWRQEAASSLLAAESTWKASEAARLALAEAVWRENWERDSAELRARAERAESGLAGAMARIEGAESAISAARSESQAVAEWHRKAERAESALAQATAQLDKAETSLAELRTETEVAGQWKVRAGRAEAALAETATRLQLTETALADVRTEAEALRNRDDSETLRVRAEASNARAALAKRDGDLAELRAAIEQAREEAKAALSRAEAEWQTGESARFAAAKNAWHEQSASALANAIARYERAEAESAKMRAEADALRHEFATAQARYAELESDVVVTRAASEPEATGWAAAPKLVYERPVPPGERPEQRDHFRHRLVRDMVLVAAVAAVGIALYPRLPPIPQDWSPKNWSPKNAQLTTAMQSFFQMVGGPSDADTGRLPDLPAIIGARSVNLRVGPSAGSGVVATLPQASKVTQIDRRGNWILVRVAGQGGRAPQQGWVFSTFLKSPPVMDRGSSQSPHG